MTGGLEGRCSIRLSYEGLAVPMVAHEWPIFASGAVLGCQLQFGSGSLLTGVISVLQTFMPGSRK